MTTTETRRAVMIEAHKNWAHYSKVDPKCTFGKCLKLAWVTVKTPKVDYSLPTLAEMNRRTAQRRAHLQATLPAYAQSARRGAWNWLQDHNERVGAVS